MYQLSSHFLEIRLRVFYLLLSLILTIITSYYYQFEILYIIGRPFLELDHKFVLIDLTEALYTILRICGIISLLIILPFFIYHLWCFYIPSRYQFERKTINKFSIIFFFLLFVELLMLYFVIFPKICEFLLNFEIISSNSSDNLLSKLVNFESKSKNNIDFLNQIQNPIDDLQSKKQLLLDSNLMNFQLNKTNKPLDIIDLSTELINRKIPVLMELTARLESYVRLSTRFYFIMLTLFQIPFFVIMLYYYNIIDCYILCKFRKFFLFFSLLISAFISPPDIISQSLLAILIFFFYELLIFLGIFYSISFSKK